MTGRVEAPLRAARATGERYEARLLTTLIHLLTGYTYAPVRKSKAAAAAAAARSSPAPSSAASASTSGPSTPVEVPLPYPTPSCLSPGNPITHHLRPFPYGVDSASPSVFAYNQEQCAAAWQAMVPADVWPTPPSSAAGLRELAFPADMYAHMPLSTPVASASYSFDFGCAVAPGMGELLPTTPLPASSPAEGFPFQASHSHVYEQFPQDMYTPARPFDVSFDGLDCVSAVSIESPFGFVSDATVLGEALATNFHTSQQGVSLVGSTPTFAYEFLNR